jgi:hypothetical protein
MRRCPISDTSGSITPHLRATIAWRLKNDRDPSIPASRTHQPRLHFFVGRRGPTGAATEAAEREIVELLKRGPGRGRRRLRGERGRRWGRSGAVEEVAGSRRDCGRGQRRLASDGAEEVAPVTPSHARRVRRFRSMRARLGAARVLVDPSVRRATVRSIPMGRICCNVRSRP